MSIVKFLPSLYNYHSTLKTWSSFPNPWIWTGPETVLTKRMKRNWFYDTSKLSTSFLLEPSCQCCEIQAIWEKKKKWEPKHSDQQCQLSSLTSQHQPLHTEVGRLGSSNQVKLPEDCSPNWHIVKQKGCPAKSSQPTETWDNDYCFRSLNSGMVSHTAIDHLPLGILLIYLSPKARTMLNWKRLEIVSLKSKIR